jgi:hypothetical protein
MGAAEEILPYPLPTSILTRFGYSEIIDLTRGFTKCDT